MKTKNKKQRKILLLLVLLLAVTVGFALLSTTLFINGTSRIKSNDWDIHWDGESITPTSGSVTPDTPASVDANGDIAFTVNFDLPGDYYEFTVDAVNAGTIDGIISAVGTKVYAADGETELTGTNIPTDIIWSVTYADTGAPAVGDILAKRTDAEHPTAKTYKVKVQFDPAVTELPANAVSYVYKFSVKYDQYKAPAAQTSPVSVTASSTTVAQNSTATVTVSFTAAGWNLNVAGDVTETGDALKIIGSNSEGDNELVTKTFTVDTSTKGTKTITVTGDITDENEVKTSNINQSVTITVE